MNPSVFLAEDPEWYPRAKRIFDIGFALGFGTVFSFPMAIIAALVKCSGPGPILYGQARVGMGGKIFTLYKFRTMTVNPERDTAQVVQDGDPEVTAIGRVLRRTRLDELPQLWNVLKGDMTVVGPRPHPVEHAKHVAAFDSRYNERHLVVPGLVSFAHIMLGEEYPTRTPKEVARKILPHDLKYVHARTPAADLCVLLLAPFVLVGRYGV